MSNTIYEYYIHDGQFKKRKLKIERTTVVHNKKVYVVKSSNYVFLRIGDFDIVKHNRIFSFHDKEEEFKNMMIAHYEKRIQKEEKQLERLKIIHTRLKEQT